jgi:protein SCO1/2
MEWMVWGGLLLTILLVLAAFLIHPFKARPLPVLGQMSDFALTGQNNQDVNLASLRGEVWIADVIFTRCAGQCPIMSAHMQAIQDALSPGLPIKLVSFTTDPGFDTPAVLKQYGSHFGAHDDQWIFLTGSKAALRRATVDGLKLSVMDNPSSKPDHAGDLFIHSQKLVLLDQDGRIRGYFDGETADGTSQALAAAKTLARP